MSDVYNCLNNCCEIINGTLGTVWPCYTDTQLNGLALITCAESCDYAGDDDFVMMERAVKASCTLPLHCGLATDFSFGLFHCHFYLRCCFGLGDWYWQVGRLVSRQRHCQCQWLPGRFCIALFCSRHVLLY